MPHWIYLVFGMVATGLSSMGFDSHFFKNPVVPYSAGQPYDSIDGVYVYYNGPVSGVIGRNLTGDGYNLGLKYQCVEFVKRYYFEHFNHRMPDSYGHAKDFFDKSLRDGAFSKRRNLFQYSNPGKTKPRPGDILVYDATEFNEFGHVSIVSNVSDSEIEIVQQNAGPFSDSRETYSLVYQNGTWKIKNNTILGWLRKE